jgi:RNA polymerase-interacting CarD/CdnL/TRCF family regulator
MVFKVGETVVYPHHGAALIEAIETRVIKGEEKKYLVLKVAQGDLTVRVPADNAEIVGVRDVVGQEGLDRVFEVLRAPHTEEPTNWSRRYKANLEKLASGASRAKSSESRTMIRWVSVHKMPPVVERKTIGRIATANLLVRSRVRAMIRRGLTAPKRSEHSVVELKAPV